jgi:hypothetical protein
MLRRVLLVMVCLTHTAFAAEGVSLGTYADIVIEGKDTFPGATALLTYARAFIIGYENGLFVGEARMALKKGISPREMCTPSVSPLSTDEVLSLAAKKIEALKASDPHWRDREFTSAFTTVIGERLPCPASR